LRRARGRKRSRRRRRRKMEEEEEKKDLGLWGKGPEKEAAKDDDIEEEN